MYLTDEEKRMLDGEYGEGTRKSMEVQVRQGEFYDADRMVPLSLAYVVTGPDPDHQVHRDLPAADAEGELPAQPHQHCGQGVDQLARAQPVGDDAAEQAGGDGGEP